MICSIADRTQELFLEALESLTSAIFKHLVSDKFILFYRRNVFRSRLRYRLLFALLSSFKQLLFLALFHQILSR